MSTTSTAQSWSDHYASGRGSKPLSDAETVIVRERLVPPVGREAPRALDVCCGTGELARLLADLGYGVDAVDYAQGAVDRASAETGRPRVGYHCVDVTSGDLDALAPAGGFDLITIRRSLAHLGDRTRIVAELAGLLRPDGTLCVITPHADRFPESLRGICLDDAEITLLTDGWEHAERVEAEDCTVVLLSGPGVRSAAYQEKLRPKAAAMAGVAVVVTNPHGRVLLGWNPSRKCWELPAGKVEPGEAFEATAVRELAEETGLRAAAERVVLLGTLCDDTHGMTRVTEVARLTDYDGEPLAMEPELTARWEWHTPSALRSLPQPLFTASAQALNTAWPGLLPDLPPAHFTPRPAPADGGRLRFGEPTAAVRLRLRLAEDLTRAGWARTPELRAAFQAVPRQAFLPEQPLGRAYANVAVATVITDGGQSSSSVSQPEMQALMLDHGRLREGGHGLEIGGGGYNAALMAELVGATGTTGTVTCVEYDPYVHRRTVRFLQETGYADRVRVVLGDGVHGAPEHLVPAGGFDTILVTVASMDVPPAWTAQLADGGRLVVPLRLGGYTRCVAFEKQGTLLTSTHVSPCGFVPMQGIGRWDDSPVPIGESGYGIRWEDTPPAPVDALERALAGDAVELWTGVTVAGDESYETLQLWLTVALPGFCRLTGDREEGPVLLPRNQDAAAMVSGGSLGCLTVRRIGHDDTTGRPLWEFGAQGFGADAKAVADTVAGSVRAWDRDIRPGPGPVLTVRPATLRTEQPAARHVIDKQRSRIVLTFPGASS
ncbi:methyltransferase, FxLD system [Streptomyces stackebrandtii]|uniref:methyltransferase, FxLD system n=1 Tax=Streptomyces stackebrandtii TaxID=3051177 RepID=UPI0028DCD3D6|nr:methyltransferase, FxLD system [Streptomyces sp. DSM 40976]